MLSTTVNEDLISAAKSAPSLPIFSDQVCDFLASVSSRAVRVGRAYPAVTSFGYWCRAAALKSYKAAYEGDSRRLGRGLAFHVAPSNVPVNFAFSLAAGLLAGNKNIVRVPSKDFDEVRILSRVLDEALAEHPDMKPYVNLVRYSRGGAETDLLSAACDARIIWGGDATVTTIRKSQIHSRAVEVTFADRKSLAIVDAQAYLDNEDPSRVANGFYNDTFLSDQNACTSPHLVVWLGNPDAIAEAKKSFWGALEHETDEHAYEIAPVHSIGKLAAFYQSAAHRAQTLVDGKSGSPITRVNLDALDDGLFLDCYHSGLFFEYSTNDLEELVPLLDNTRVQTVSYVGQGVRDVLAALVVERGIAGVDRVVPIGHTMDFNLIWDGTDLIRTLSRVVSSV